MTNSPTDKTNEFTLAKVLGENGLIARRLKHYELRPQQFAMACAVEAAIHNSEHLIVEAGTGVGKSFAYLVPAIMSSTKTSEKKKKRKVVISTNTISLQEQLMEKDIPFLNAILPIEFSAVMVKGRSNYLSLRRLKVAGERAYTLLSNSEQTDQLCQIEAWTEHTTDGSLSDLHLKPLHQVWDLVASEHGNCLGKKCPTYQPCFYQKARRRIWNADLLIVNHALFFSDLSLRREGAKILPDYDVVIFDEAHAIESVAADHMGLSVSSGQLDYLLNRLYNDRTQKGVLVTHALKECQRLVTSIRHRQREFFYIVGENLERYAQPNGRLRKPMPLQNSLMEPLNHLGRLVADFAEKLEKDEDRIELTSLGERCGTIAETIEAWLTQSMEDSVYWVENSGRRKQNTKLVCSPIEIGSILRDELFNVAKSVVLTSATLSVGQENFAFMKKRIGVSSSKEKRLGSPFDYGKQVDLYLHTEMPDPSAEPEKFENAVCEKIKHHVEETKGRAFVLFTNYSMLNRCADRLADWLVSRNISLYRQGGELPRSQMLDRFRKDDSAVLFGADSFWQGVDVPGEALQNVIIAKLPFSVPDQPLIEARLEKIRARNGNPFMEYQLPEAVLKLKQGFGRLIRSRLDTGRIVILDPRIKTKRYGKLFLESLPKCHVIFS